MTLTIEGTDHDKPPTSQGFVALTIRQRVRFSSVHFEDGCET
jgi:hypothetical protein